MNNATYTYTERSQQALKTAECRTPILFSYKLITICQISTQLNVCDVVFETVDCELARQTIMTCIME